VTIHVALTDCMGSAAKAVLYNRWIEQWIPDVRIHVLSYVQGNMAELDQCHGLVLSGGVDVDPRLYGVPDVLSMATEIDQQRDSFEMRAIDAALRRKMALFAICRGMQIFNVFCGGTLMLDIESAGHPSHSRSAEGDRRHGIEVVPGTALHATSGLLSGEANSAHHQAIDRLGRGLRVAARSSDGIIEAIEWEEADSHSPVQLVQWHPERMDDSENPLTKALILHFASSIQHQITQ
jgi:putative glutamine amidotransferase